MIWRLIALDGGSEGDFVALREGKGEHLVSGPGPSDCDPVETSADDALQSFWRAANALSTKRKLSV